MINVKLTTSKNAKIKKKICVLDRANKYKK